MDKKVKKLGSIFVTIMLVGFLGFFLYKNSDSFSKITEINYLYLFPISTLIVFMLYINGIFLKLLAKPFNIDLKEHFLLSIVASFFNLITPFRGGAGVRAVYMKKVHKLKYSEFASSLFGNYVIIFLVSSLSALLLFIAIYFLYQIFNLITFLIFLVIFLGTFLSIMFHFNFKKENFITSKINKVLKGWKAIAKHPNLIFKLTIFSIINLLTSTLIIQLIFTGIGQHINFLQAYYLSIMTILAIFINITPGSIGITEGLYIISASIINISPEISLIAALILRATNSIILLILGPIANYILLKKHKNLKTSLTSQK